MIKQFCRVEGSKRKVKRSQDRDYKNREQTESKTNKMDVVSIEVEQKDSTDSFDRETKRALSSDFA